MNIPPFWAKARVTEKNSSGEEVSFSCWRSSTVSDADAQQAARAAAAGVVRKLLAGAPLDRYGYSDRPMREEVLERLNDAAGQPYALITRNAAGCLVLNTSRVLFVDVDFPESSLGAAVGGLLGRLFGRRQPAAPDPQTAAVARFEQFAAANAGWSARLYRTAAGLRALVTHDLFAPTAEATLSLLAALGSDPLYIRLCKAQECFRARLTPKPWRCGHHANYIRWPIEGEPERTRFDRWLAEYTSKQAEFATCRLIGTVGAGRVHPEADAVIRLHDDATRAGEELELA